MVPAANVQGKRILITGGSSGIGAASGILLARRGARVIISDLSAEQGEKLASDGSKEGLDIKFRQVDVSDGRQVRSLFTYAVESLGGIDVVLNNAGVDHDPRPMHELTDEDFDRNIAINLKGVWHCMRAAIVCMAPNGGGHVINLASIAGLRSAPSLAAYSASKHGVVGLTKTAAIEYAKVNIRFNAVCPSFIDTPMVQNNLDKLDERGKNLIVKASPLKRLGHVDEIAHAIAWLASNESSFMNGHCLTLDGGMLA